MERRDFLKLTAAGSLALTGCHNPLEPSGSHPADLVLLDAKIATCDANFSFAQALAVRNSRIIKVGTNQQIKPTIGKNTRVINLNGKLVTPGLTDAHAHLLEYGETLGQLDLRDTKTFREIVNQVASHAQSFKPGQWILGRNWDQNRWPSKQMPNHQQLSNASPDNPVWLTRVDGHAALANQKAMEMAGITKDTPSPNGGEILRDPQGNPNGVFVDHAMSLVARHIPESTTEQKRQYLLKATDSCLKVGLTGIHDAALTPDTIPLLKQLIDNDQLGIRVNAMMANPGSNVADYMRQHRVQNYADHALRINSVKLFMDGALGSRGAALLEPYSDKQGHTGLLTSSYDHALQVATAALRDGFQVCTHAIGDRANHLILNAYQQALEKYPKTDHRFRVEHAQILAPTDIPRFAQLNVIPSMQPTHATSDMPWAQDRLGPERIKGAYAWRSLLNTGVSIPCGSDFPVESNNPMFGIYAAITRQDHNTRPPGGWFQNQCMTRPEALRGFTSWAAHAAFQEDVLGSIETGKLADLTVLSKDILTIGPKEILDTKPLYTIVAGKIRYQAG